MKGKVWILVSLLNIKSQVNNSGVKVLETGFESANVSSGHGRYGSNTTRVVEELETLLKSTNASAVVDPLKRLKLKKIRMKFNMTR
ncbi:hypothetical protein Hdeb2414_s0009g00313211 [Helianthus debilis subsp. tardiflorus]